ncbi:MAG TPA: RNA methyltransferase [Blastocatellia bacterium]|nr:RNA methyltransferase [Blastocatellia bacterium]
MHDEPTGNFRQLAVEPTLAKVRKLQEDRGFRDRNGLFFIEGVRNFIWALDYHSSLDAILYSEKLLINPVARKLVRKMKRSGVPFVRLTPEEFRSISGAERASGVAAIVVRRVLALDQLNPMGECWTALEHFRSPGNFGTLMRSSAATGGAGFILLGNAIDPFDPSVVRATMGSLFTQKIARASAAELQRWTRQHNVQVIGASPDGAIDYDRIRYSRPTLLVLGTERSGLTAQQRSLCHRIVRIPMAERIDSLNLGVAGSLLMYRVFRESGRVGGRSGRSGERPPTSNGRKSAFS